MRRLLPLLMVFTTVHAVAQTRGITSRDQAEGWFLPVKCSVSANGGKTGDVTVTIFKDNDQVAVLAPEKKKSAFALELDLDSYYTIQVSKEGYRSKTVYVDTNLPTHQVKYGAYECYVNLEPMDKFIHADPFYLDFPSAIVRWAEEKTAFSHSDDYVANIQVRMALLGAQIETK